MEGNLLVEKGLRIVHFEDGKEPSMFEGKTVVVFGGSGSIGSLIVEQLLKEKVETVRLFALSEQSVFEAKQRFGTERMRYIEGDIRNYRQVKSAIRGCDYVFNAAAKKHLDLSEYNPMETVSTNINGLDNILTACIEQKVKKFLHISSDKACNPTSLMGATKLIGERLVQVRNYQNPFVDMVITRLGNVYGSRGSLVPIVQKLKAENKPILITDKGMIRYFMQPNEVIDFIMKAFNEGKEGEIWVPKLEPQCVMNVIREIVGFDYPIVEIGKKRGEKMKEDLISIDELFDTIEYDKYFIIKNKLEV